MNLAVRRAAMLLKQFKGRDYVFGTGCFGRLPELVMSLGSRVTVISSGVRTVWGDTLWEKTEGVLRENEITPSGPRIAGAGPNAPHSDVLRLADAIRERNSPIVLVLGGGSGIDAAKAATVMATLGDDHPDLDAYFGVGRVSSLLAGTRRRLPFLIAVQLASSSGAHLTKYSNITDMERKQKKLIVDDAIIPTKALFDYSFTLTMSREFTADGAMDGLAHAVEVMYGDRGQSDLTSSVCATAVELIIKNVGSACSDPQDLDARRHLGLGTDLGGYAIMLGGTNGAHLTSFSLVDILPHGRACALMNPYYTVFFAPAIEPQLRLIGSVFVEAGLADRDILQLGGRALGTAVAEAMMSLSRHLGLPTSLGQVVGFSEDHIRRALEAARDPQLDMKLRGMPVPLSADSVCDYMGPVLEAAKTGDLSLIRNMT